METATRILKAILSLFALFLAGATIYLYFHPTEIPSQLQSFAQPAPCSRPIVYTIGSIDPHFGISQSDFVKILIQAATVWNTASGHTLLTFSTSSAQATLPVSLVFDEREAALLLGNQIQSAQETASSKRIVIQSLEAQVVALKASYTAAADALKQKVTAYDGAVADANASDGANKATYDSLNATRIELQQAQTALNAQADQINNLNDTLNQDIQTFNAQIQNTNQQVTAFNSKAGDFEQGLYQKDSNGTRITIYSYKNQNELMRTLEHEFGHALGLEHNSNPNSIMYPYIEDLTTGPSVDDMNALKAVCNF